MIQQTLERIDAWFTEPGIDNDRSRLLSKLALLELCGWLEGEFDRLALVAEAGRLSDPDWVRKKVIKRTNGFTYDDHWRVMLVAIVGEVFARRVEHVFDQQCPGDRDRLKTTLDALWKVRCSFAHADVGANIAAQQTFDAPSVTLARFRSLRVLLGNLEQAMTTALATI